MNDIIQTDDYFLSGRNPIATADQIHVETTVLRILAREDVQAAIQGAIFRWRRVSGDASREAMQMIETAIGEYAVNYCIKAANSDANYPRVVQNWMPQHEWFGHAFPAARIGGDNPDNGYRLIPIEHGAAYRIDGRRFRECPADVTWTIVANPGTSVTLSSLSGNDVDCDSGRFSITVDNQPANGRRNHLQTKRGALFVFVRDALGDWQHEKPNTLRAYRLSAPSAPPIDDDEIAWRAIDWMLADVPLYYWFTRLNTGQPANTLTTPTGTGSVGGLISQFNSISLLRINDDEGFVLTVNPGGAAYRGLVAHDWWYRSIDYWRITSSLNNSQMTPDQDGNYTFVVSIKDPGIHNWIDTGGLHEVLLLHRWQGVAKGTPPEKMPRVLHFGLFKLADLDANVPKGVARVDGDQRRRQLAERIASWNSRNAL